MSRFYDTRGRLYDPNADMIEVPCLTRAELRGASPWRLNTQGAPAVGPSWQADAPSNFQGFPNTALELLAWLGNPVGWTAANVLAVYQCDTASPLVDSLGLGPNLVAAGGPLTGRECVGLGQAGSFGSKVGVELRDTTNDRFVAANPAFMNVSDADTRSALVVLRIDMRASVWPGFLQVDPLAGGGWYVSYTGGNLQLFGWPVGGGASLLATLPFADVDAAWLCLGVVLRGPTHTGALFSNIGDSDPGLPYGVGQLISIGSLAFGQTASFGADWPQQVAYLACFDVALTSAMRANFWRHGLVHVPYLHARTNPLIAPISAHRVAAWSGGNVGQAALGYDASLVTVPDGNPLGTGYVCEDGATFEPIGSDDFYTNAGVAGSAKSSVDGPSGMRDGCRITMTGNWAPGGNECYLPSGSLAIVGASNIPWRADVDYRRATVNTTARFGMQFDGDAGGSEYFTLISDAASPVDWLRAGGTCTPVRAGQTVCYAIMGANLIGDDCDFGEPAVVKNRTTAPLAWRRVGIVAAAQTTTPSFQVTNTLNRYYSPLRGQVDLIIGNCQLSNGAVFLSYGAAGAAGALVADYSGAQLRVRIWDVTPALVCTMLCGPLTAARTRVSICWDVLAPLRGIGGAYAAVLVNDVVVGAWLATWVPPTAAVTPLAIGCDTAGGSSARCFIELA